eukprot:XP_001707204.1 Hypothetical protein GL50803_34585 [Giardia lamblia ATCC 50803]
MYSTDVKLVWFELAIKQFIVSIGVMDRFNRIEIED